MGKRDFLIFLVLVFIGLMGCQGQAETIEKITIYDLENSLNKLVLEDSETISMIEGAISTAKKVAGIVDMADPEYRMELGERTYFLWLDEKSGTIMNTVDTHTIYSLTDSSIKQFNELIQDWNKK
ncbi:hypothetical protein [Ornithinibacillus scapharcae]|uniref:hypothetical protein n=1 Tax=Ornithinibacillus scapharcae TaxID=1147159 RepID=UPI000225B2C8|nr:hypothetical protein [Ornithinibacillus scapharcae]